MNALSSVFSLLNTKYTFQILYILSTELANDSLQVHCITEKTGNYVWLNFPQLIPVMPPVHTCEDSVEGTEDEESSVGAAQ